MYGKGFVTVVRRAGSTRHVAAPYTVSLAGSSSCSGWSGWESWRLISGHLACLWTKDSSEGWPGSSLSQHGSLHGCLSFCFVLLVFFFYVVVIKCHDLKISMRRKGFIWLACPNHSPSVLRSQGRNWKWNLKDRPWSNTAHWLALTGLFSLLLI